MPTYHPDSLEIVGAIAEGSAITHDIVTHLFSGEVIDMLHGADFTGKPGTKVYASHEHILKVKTEILLERGIAIKWVEEQLRRERTLGIYHPSKTWLLVAGEGGYCPANVCQRLVPLHMLLAGEARPAATAAWRVELLLRLFRFYLDFSQATQLRMDEGLSNFALDAEERLYYIDDDIYQWDDFHAFTQALGIYFRSLSLLSHEGEIVVLAEGLRSLVAQVYDGDPIWFSVIAEQLHQQFFPEELRAVVARFIATLNPQRRRATPSVARHDYLVVMADIHANSWAFSRVLQQLARDGVRHGVIAGDIVGYGPEPNECVQMAAESGLVVVQGNHDYAMSRGVAGKGFTASARWSFDWTMSVIDEPSRAWLAGLPPLYQGEGYMVVHGAPIDPTFINAYVYQMTYESNLNWMQHNGVSLCFHGHSHIQGAYLRDQQLHDRFIAGEALELGARTTCLLCPGSVGQPREAAIGAQYAIYDVRRQRITLHALPYDSSALHRRMAEYQFPERITRMFP